MQLLAIILYSAAGEQRVIRFRPGALNVVTGVSATGKSALLDIVDFCLGRSTLTMAVGPISDRVEWYAVIVQLPNGQAFVARPAARPGAASTQVAMLELGTELSPIPFDRLEANADIGTVREQLGRRIGIEENEHEAPEGSLRNGLEANLGHAMFLCLQGQGEIANRSFLFHRQGETGIADAIKDTLPYFLGAVPRDQGVLRQRLADARRELRRAEADLQRARLVNEDVEVQVRGLVTEAIALGLLASDTDGGRAELHQALQRVAATEAVQSVGDDELAVRRSQLESRRTDLRARLRATGEQIALLDSLRSGGNEFGVAVAQQISRLRSVDLLGADVAGDDSCPICGSHLDVLDPTVDELRRQADELQSQLQSMDVALPAQRGATERLQGEADALRQELRGVDAAVNGLDADQQAAGVTRRVEEQQVFFRGRVQQYLSTAQGTDAGALRELEQRVAVRGLAVEGIESQLDPDEEREQIASRLAVVGTDMTHWAGRLNLEHQTSVRLDLRRLTIVTDTPTGPAPLSRIGSAENWVGYHLISHLALHRYFTRENRPVPHFLMLDQPTQAYYPSDVERATGVPAADDDRQAVQRLYELMRDVAAELAPSMQIIACDHANLPEEWFQQAVIANWRDGEKLIPESWLEDAN
jgi:phage shock protein A